MGRVIRFISYSNDYLYTQKSLLGIRIYWAEYHQFSKQLAEDFWIVINYPSRTIHEHNIAAKLQGFDHKLEQTQNLHR